MYVCVKGPDVKTRPAESLQQEYKYAKCKCRPRTQKKIHEMNVQRRQEI